MPTLEDATPEGVLELEPALALEPELWALELAPGSDDGLSLEVAENEEDDGRDAFPLVEVDESEQRRKHVPPHCALPHAGPSKVKQ